MNRQHATPILVPSTGPSLALPPLALGISGHGLTEADAQTLIQHHPSCLPIKEIDPLFANPIPICMELGTAAGSIDNFMITATALPVLVECKLWRNPEGRREVVGQILDYAKELSRWSAADLRREIGRRVGRSNAMLEIIQEAGYNIDEIDFTDALTFNLRRGRFLLLVVGDGIREGVEAIAEYLRTHANLHFTFGLVELPVHALPDGSRLIVPRVLVRTALISREVIALPEGFSVQEAGAGGDEGDEEMDEATLNRVSFMREIVSRPLELDPEQPTPRVSPKGWLSIYLPAPASSCWISVLKKDGKREVGVRLTSNVGTVGEAAIRIVAQDWNAIKQQLGGHPTIREPETGRFIVEEFVTLNSLSNLGERREAIDWVRGRVRDFVAIFRPRIKQAVEIINDSSP